MQSKATTVAAYLASLPADRRAALCAVRDVIRANLDRDFEEGMQYGMIGYYLPHAVFPAGYHCDPRQPLPYAMLASQKSHMSVHLMGLYIHGGNDPRAESPDAKWFREAWAKTGKKLDMGAACVRFKKLEDVALDVLGQAIRRVPAKTYIARYTATLAKSKAGTKPGAKSKAPAKARAATRKASAKPMNAPTARRPAK